MACGTCGVTGISYPSFSVSNVTATAVNPLTGAPLLPGQILVTGPASTGPRVTVLDPTKPSTWPAWITSVNGKPVDDGTIGGGTYSGYRLPDVVATAAKYPWWWGLFLVIVIIALAAGPVRRK